MYIWKVLEAKVHNPGIQTVPLNEHQGRMCNVPSQEIIKELQLSKSPEQSSSMLFQKRLGISEMEGLKIQKTT